MIKPAHARSPLLVLMAAAATLSLSGCTLFADGVVPDVEVMQSDLVFPEASPTDGRDVALAVPFKLWPGRLGISRDAFSGIRVLSVSISAKSGVNDLGFLHAARITLAGGDSGDAGTYAGHDPIEIARYSHPDGNPTGPQVMVETDPPTDVTEVWRSSPRMIFVAEVAGQLPTVPWTADIAIRFGADLKY